MKQEPPSALKLTPAALMSTAARGKLHVRPYLPAVVVLALQPAVLAAIVAVLLAVPVEVTPIVQTAPFVTLADGRNISYDMRGDAGATYTLLYLHRYVHGTTALHIRHESIVRCSALSGSCQSARGCECCKSLLLPSAQAGQHDRKEHSIQRCHNLNLHL